MWLAATRVSTAPGSAARGTPARPSPTTARLRVVGMPSACIASLMMYSRSIGPSAARPSPRRENGVGPAPLSWMSNAIAAGRDLLAEQNRAAIAERGEVPELMARVGLRQRRRARRAARCPRKSPPVRASSASASSPSAVASGRLNTTSRGALTGVGVTAA